MIARYNEKTIQSDEENKAVMVNLPKAVAAIYDGRAAGRHGGDGNCRSNCEIKIAKRPRDDEKFKSSGVYTEWMVIPRGAEFYLEF